MNALDSGFGRGRQPAASRPDAADPCLGRGRRPAAARPDAAWAFPELQVAALRLRVAELEVALARALASDDGSRDRAGAAAVREQAVVDRLRPLFPTVAANRHARGAARLLIHLVERPGRLCRHPGVLNAIRGPQGVRRPGRHLTSVVVHWTRKALALGGVEGAIVAVRGRGLMLTAEAAPAVRALVEGRA